MIRSLAIIAGLAVVAMVPQLAFTFLLLIGVVIVIAWRAKRAIVGRRSGW